MKKGKFIVIDGTDGTGKATQTALLVKKLKALKIKVKTIDFPQYQNNFFGSLIGGCLAGKYGVDYLKIDPHIISVLYAADRWESSEKIKKWLNDGFVVIADRYVSANQIHQGGKIQDDTQRKDFLKWLDVMEYKVFKIPKPDAVIYMSLPIELTLKLLLKKETLQKKKYLKGRKDLAENDKEHLENSRRSGMKIVQDLNNWFQIDCSNNGDIVSIDKIHELVFNKVSKILKLK
jgi:dTMP kinase